MEKKLLFTVFIALLTTISVKAYDFRVDGLCYNILNSTGSKSVEVTYETDDETENYSSLSGDIVIPNSVIYNGVEYYVTYIGSNAFKGCKSLISITLPTYMGVIRNNAFEGCELLTSIVLPDYLAYIDEWSMVYFYDGGHRSCGGWLDFQYCPNYQYRIGHCAYSLLS